MGRIELAAFSGYADAQSEPVDLDSESVLVIEFDADGNASTNPLQAGEEVDLSVITNPLVEDPPTAVEENASDGEGNAGNAVDVVGAPLGPMMAFMYKSPQKDQTKDTTNIKSKNKKYNTYTITSTT